MTYRIKWLIITFFALNYNTSKIFAQDNSILVNAINDQLIPLKTVSDDLDFMDFNPLNSILKEKQIIALGEATHGSHEFFLYKHRMLEYLVKKTGIKTIVLEADFTGTQVMNDFVLNGKGTAAQCLLGMGFSGTTQEFIDLVNWLKSYNDTQLAENKVSIYGCDMQYPVFAVKKIKDYLVQKNLLTPDLNIGFDAMNKYYSGLTGKEKTALRKMSTNLSAIKFEDQDTANNALYKRDLRLLQQFVELTDAQSKLFPAKQSDVRDKYMAENCEWIYNYTRQNKMMLWEHNEHISRSKNGSGYIRMGNYLAETLKDKYYVIGFDFYNGKMRSFDMKSKKNVAAELPHAKDGSSGAIFSQCKVPNFILDFKTASANPIVTDFLKNKIYSSAYGAAFNKGQAPSYIQHKLIESYDAVIFIRETNPAMDMKSAN
ncbi:erythromycin esterase family protein [Pedobacter sp. PLR]|uniref:erythromycin esterase family protein n=1 Tax=Pedobacter sp. PLR TaxID=2994465 RepID=UPI002245A0DB|nr:erythromycin esterase family protein [Pedobacter sp. PLR]MCX2454217.1 erythromycin esterase family protein [Pedobacter sp. PLR]